MGGWQMRKRKLISQLAFWGVLGGVCAWVYGTHEPVFKVENCRFAIKDGLGKPSEEAEHIKGEVVGVIEKRTPFYPEQNLEGFNLPKGATIYSISPDEMKQEDRRLVVEVDGKYYEATLYSESVKEAMAQIVCYEERFNER